MAFLSGFLKTISNKRTAVITILMCSLTILSAQENFNNFSRAGEFLIDTNLSYSPALNWQISPSLACGDSIYMVVWEDARRYDNVSYRDIYATRVHKSGIVLDPAGLFIADSIVSPSITYGGNCYLVVWRDNRSGSYWDIYCARIDQSGVILDSGGIEVAHDYGMLGGTSVAYDGTNFLVVWVNNITGIYCARVSLSGIVLDTVPREIYYNDFGYMGGTSIAFDGVNYLVSWINEDYEMWGYTRCARIDINGNLLDSVPILLPSGDDHAGGTASVFDGLNYFVVYTSGGGIFGVRISPSGILVDSTRIFITGGLAPAASFDGENYLVVWYTYSAGPDSVFAARVSTTGVVIDTIGIPITNTPGYKEYPRIAFDGSNYLVVWRDCRNAITSPDIYGVRIDTSVAVLDTNGIAISTSANWQELPAGAFNNGSYFHVWRDSRNISSDIYGILSDSLGHALDTSIAISTAIKEQTNPAISSSSDQFLCVWQDCRIDSMDSDIYGARLDSTGHLLDPQGIMISSASYRQSIPAAASCSTSYFTIWQDWRNNNYDIYGTRVSRNGVVLDPNGILISIYQPSYQQTSPAIAFDGSNYQVVYSDNTYGANDIFGVRVDTSGNIIVPFMVISNAYSGQYTPAVAFNGSDDYMVVWEDDRNGSDFRDIYGTVVDTSGYVVYPDGFPISIATGQQRYPSICFDGINYLVSWMDNRNGNWDIYGAKVSSTGQVLNTYAIMTDANDQYAPALIKGDTDKLFISWSGWTDSINGRPANTMRIWGKIWPFIGIEEARYEKPDARMLCYPNPFFSHLTIKFQKDAKTRYELKIYDATGRLIKQYNGISGDQVIWDGKDAQERQVPCGVYFVRLESGDVNEQVKKVVLLK